jgi:hypothetical protein
MLSVILDTGLFSVPPYVQNENQAHEMILRLSHWSTFVEGDAPFQSLKLSDAESSLIVSNCWPADNDIRTLLTMFQLNDVFSVRDVASMYSLLLQKSIVVSERYQEVCECSEVLIVPNVLGANGPSGIICQSELSYMNQCFSTLFRPNEPTFVASGIPGPIKDNIVVSGVVASTKGPGSENFSVPVSISEKLYLLTEIEDVLKFHSAIYFWNCAVCLEDFFLAIAFGCVELERHSGKTFSLRDVPSFTIGPRFIESLSPVQGGPNQSRASVTFEACCRVILRKPKNRLSEMRLSNKTKAPINNASAWRTHVTSRHEALRLMLWKTGDSIELANVGNKQELHIEPNSGAAYGHIW